MDADVIVVGGAVAGGAVANAFGSLGVRTLLVEKVEREVHSTRGDLLHPPTLALLDRWGVLADLHADGALPIDKLAVSHSRRGRIAEFPTAAVDDGPAGRTLAVPHDRIEAVLYECALSWPSVSAQRGVVTGVVRDANGRVDGVRVRTHGANDETELQAKLVVGCDGSQSMVRRALGISAQPEQYDHEQIIIGGEGPTELPAALHWYLDEIGRVCVVSRPRGGFRILLTLPLGERGDLLRLPDPALHEYLVGRFPALTPLRFRKTDAHLYRLFRQVADRFWAPGVALVGDSAHTTHPAGATGMSLAISDAARLADRVAPLLLAGAPSDKIDSALSAYDEERRPAALAAVEANHLQALRLWQSDLFLEPDAYAQAVDPAGNWGAGGAGWGADPGALAFTGRG
ncbi:MAG: FAD-dependent monooxygenase [Chloroflexi bacterium]|nr:FAD-dependent monooxygenase [Chloroflexota bacterium]